MTQSFKIGNREVGGNNPCYIIAEVSCNHEGDINEARKIIDAAAYAGVDAVKLQTYTADTISRNFKNKPTGTIWESMDLHKLYDKAHTPWEWAFALKKQANDLGMDLLSSPFDETAVDFLVDELGVDVLKVASFEMVDTKLLQKMAETSLPIIMSNGMTDYLEIEEAVRVLRSHGATQLSVLHCNSGYPAAFSEANLNTITALDELFHVVPGLSDHTLFYNHDNYEGPMAHITPFEGVKMGAKIIELHLMLNRSKARALFEKNVGGFDWPFSREPDELKKTIDMIRAYERGETVEYDTEQEREVAKRTHGKVCFTPTEKEMNSRNMRPSLWVVEDIKAGEEFKFCGGNPGNIDSIRPAGGLHVRFANVIEGKYATRDIQAGTALTWDMVDIHSEEIEQKRREAIA